MYFIRANSASTASIKALDIKAPDVKEQFALAKKIEKLETKITIDNSKCLKEEILRNYL